MAITGQTSISGASDDSWVVFRPRVWRAFLMILAMSAVLIACVEAALYAAGRLFTSDYRWALLLGLWLVWSMFNTSVVRLHYAISIGASRVSGRSSGLGSWGGEQHYLPLSDLDPVRSAKRNWANRVFGNQRFYSTSGQSIYFLRGAFSRADVREITRLLSLPE
jgi:hypothetical protein